VTDRVDLTVVIPAYNEAGRLGPSLAKAVEYLARRGGSWELLVVDDGSGDATSAVAADFAEQGVVVLRHPVNRGKGAAVRTGLLASRGDRVLLSDADFSTPVTELEKLEAHLAEAPVVIGSRAAAGADVRRRQPLYRELMGKVFNRIIRLLGAPGIADTQCGFKLLDGDAARSLAAELTIEGFAYDVELLWLAKSRGLPIREVGVVWINSPESKVSPLRSSLAMLRDVLRIRRRRHRRHRRHLR
jgi:dolichyl-phosphate beta-glucosyltransferase